MHKKQSIFRISTRPHVGMQLCQIEASRNLPISDFYRTHEDYPLIDGLSFQGDYVKKTCISIHWSYVHVFKPG